MVDASFESHFKTVCVLVAGRLSEKYPNVSVIFIIETETDVGYTITDNNVTLCVRTTLRPIANIPAVTMSKLIHR
jgi:hypothetical protein